MPESLEPRTRTQYICFRCYIMVELIKRAVYLTDENLPTLAAQRPSAYGDEWLKPGAWDVEAKGAAIPDAPRFSPYQKGQLAVSPFRRFALSPFRRFAVSPIRPIVLPIGLCIALWPPPPASPRKGLAVVVQSSSDRIDQTRAASWLVHSLPTRHRRPDQRETPHRAPKHPGMYFAVPDSLKYRLEIA
jgi:hypothetical protein